MEYPAWKSAYLLLLAVGMGKFVSALTEQRSGNCVPGQLLDLFCNFSEPAIYPLDPLIQLVELFANVPTG